MADSRLVHKDLLLHPGYCSLKLFARDLYWRIWLNADDFGRYHAATSLLRPFLYPTELDKTRESDIERALLDLESASLVRLYNESGARYLEIPAELYRQRLRSKSKFPAPPAADPPQPAVNCQQSAAIRRNPPQPAALYGDEYGDEIEKESGDIKQRSIAPAPAEHAPSSLFESAEQRNQYRQWLTAIKGAHPAGRERASIPRPFHEQTAIPAWRTCPTAHHHADLLRAFYESKITTSTTGRPFKRPMEFKWYLVDLADVLVSARQWAKETRWKPASERKQPKTSNPTPARQNAQEIITEAEKEDFFSELRDGFAAIAASTKPPSDYIPE